MHRPPTWLWTAGCLAVLTGACFGRALWGGEQFGYRDAAHFYYPLYQRVQAEWRAGRVPLWEPEENAGMPLLGNPTAAVLYPGKLVFALTPYPLGARLYPLAHVLLAFAAMAALSRSLGTGPAGSALAGLAYAFGMPVLFQYCNVIYLVGAAWVPLGLRAADQWLRLGRRRGLLELSAVLAMETLGGDPEAAYLTGIAAGGYAALLAWSRRPSKGRKRSVGWLALPGVMALPAAWVGGTLWLGSRAAALRPWRPTGQPAVSLPWVPWVGPAVLAAWGLAGVVLVTRWRSARRAGGRPVLVPMLAGLAGAGALAAAVSGAQLFPVLEFTAQSGRAAGEGAHDIFPFSLEPARVVEFLWPNVFGTSFRGNRSWLAAVPPAAKTTQIWVPSLYAGGLTVVLALTAAQLRGGPPCRRWLTGLALLSLLGSFGEFAGPLWVARGFPGLAARLGPRDPRDVVGIRLDRHLRDGDGSLYGLAATALPGFGQFRYPSKLLTFTLAALTALAGQGWDALASGDPRARRRVSAWAAGLLAASLLALGGSAEYGGRFVAWLEAGAAGGSLFGPLDAAGALGQTRGGLAQGAAVFALTWGLARWGGRRPALAAALAMGALTADLAAANARYVLTVPQRLLDGTPEALARIAESEAADPSPGPYRVHRTPLWSPYAWHERASADRVREFVAWERATIQPKYGIPFGVHYTMTQGVAELYDHQWFFGPFHQTANPEAARAIGVEPGRKLVAYPRRSFDLWNTRYFVLPFGPRWDDEHRGFASFLDRSERIYPPLDAFDGPGGEGAELEWARAHDFQVRRNLVAYPRAWVVHGARYLKSIRGLDRRDRDAVMQEILYADEPFWHDPTRTPYDPKALAWVERDQQGELAPYLRGGATRPGETVAVVRYESDRVELVADLETPGLVVLSDVYYPGWTLTVDGAPVPVYRANRMMRGAAVRAGRHRLVYTYRPDSFRVGLWVSGAGLGAMALLGLVAARHPVSPTLGPPPDDPAKPNEERSEP